MYVVAPIKEPERGAKRGSAIGGMVIEDGYPYDVRKYLCNFRAACPK
jgi:hypothetical protein